MDDRNKLLTTEEIAEHLRLSVRSIHGLTASHAIPHRRIGRKCLFRLDEIESWLDGALLETIVSPRGRIVKPISTPAAQKAA